MTEYARERLGKFIENYVDIQPGRLFTEQIIIRQALAQLVIHGVFSENDLTRKILKDCGILIAPSVIQGFVATSKSESGENHETIF